MKKRILSFLIIPCLLLSMAAMPVLAGSSGTCGANLVWMLDNNGKLTIGGTGPMADYEKYYSPQTPWYSSRSEITSVVINGGVTSIGRNAFYGCTNLTSITIPDSVTSIGLWAFDGCNGIASVTIPGSVKNIPAEAFSGCKGLTSVIIGDGVTKIGNSAFYECSNLTSITIPNSVTSIEYSAFFGCSSLTSITIPNGVTSINSQTFSGCSSLISVTIPSGVTDIENTAFRNCSSIISVTIPDSIENIKEMAFDDCNNLTDIYYSGSEEQWKKINIRFYNSSARECNTCLKNAIMHYNYAIPVTSAISGTCGDGLKWTLDTSYKLTISGTGAIPDYDETAAPWYSLHSSIKTVAIENGVTAIGNRAFSGCGNLTAVKISDSVKTIGENIFDGCGSLVSIDVSLNNTLFSSEDGILFDKDKMELICFPAAKEGTYTVPDSVISICDYAFYCCGGLTSLIIYSGLEDVGDFAFSGCNNLTDIYYTGSEQDWGKITIGSDNIPLLLVTKHFDYTPIPPVNYGDVNGDGKINAKDNAFLARYLANWAGYSGGDMAAADVNADGVVTAKDNAVLARHLAKWTGYDTLPYLK